MSDKKSKRETEVLDLVMEGRSNKEIARALGCAEATVKVHIKRVMRRTGYGTRTKLAVEHLRAQSAVPGGAREAVVKALRRARGTVNWAVYQHDVGTPYRETDEAILADIDAALAAMGEKI